MDGKPEKRALDRFALALIFAFVFIPIFGFLGVWPFPSPITNGATLAFVGLLAGCVFTFSSGREIHYNLPILHFGALVVVLVVSIFFNSYAFDASWRWYLLALATVLVLLSSAAKLKSHLPESLIISFPRFLWLGCTGYAVISLLNFSGLLALVEAASPELGGARLVGPWGQPNLTTTMCWLGLLAGSVSFSKRPGHFLWWLSVLVLGSTLAFAASRMSWLILFGLVLLIGFSWLPKYRVRETEGARANLSFALVATLVLLIAAPQIYSLRSVSGEYDQRAADVQVVSLIERGGLSQSGRLSEFSKLSYAVKNFSAKQWILGVGPGNYPDFSFEADSILEPDRLNKGAWLHSHNIFSMMLIEFGVAGLLILIGLLIAIARAVLSRPMKLPDFFAAGGLGILFIHSNLEFPLWYFWFLALSCLFLTLLFDGKVYVGDSRWLGRALGITVFIFFLSLLFNLGSQYKAIHEVAMSESRDRSDYQALLILGNDGLMGPYAVLRRYRDFAPEARGIESQLREVNRMKAWQPRDLVALREFSLLLMKSDLDKACKAASEVAYRFPHSAPIMMEHSARSGSISPGQMADIANCIEKGLKPRGETLLSIQAKNERQLRGFSNESKP